MLSFLRALLLTGLPIFIAVSLLELFSRNKKIKKEYTRKSIHIIVGTYAAFWPLFISWTNIELLGVGALCALVTSRIFNVYKSIHLARTNAIGEFLSALSIIVVALITHDKLIYAVAILHLSLSDGLAAVVGTRYGRLNSYKVFGNRKSVVGSLTFLAISILLVSVYVAFGSHQLPWPTLIWLPIVVTMIENLSVSGTDNIFVPLLVTAALRWL